ncbi:MAG: LysR family transcriptional regulator [Lachnospiraceae bacterium]|nr:LysR family transcriptional regulator [Lachnospiraceae bacterium]
MEIRELKTFLQAAHAGSFVKAAQSMGYSQAAVTIQIKHLEEELGTVLFDRIGKQTQLTESGRTFQVRAKRILQEIEEAKAEIGNDTIVKGDLRIGTIESIGSVLMPELISKLHEQYPDITVELELDSPQVLLEKLNKNQLDVVYVMEKEIHDTNFIKVMEVREKIEAVVNKNHPFASRESAPLDEIISKEIILTEKGQAYREALEKYLAENDKEVNPFLSIGNTEFIVRYLLDREVVSFLPVFTVKEEMDKGNIVGITVEDFVDGSHPSTMYRQLLYRKDKWVNPQMKAFIDVVQKTEEEKK